MLEMCGENHHRIIFMAASSAPRRLTALVKSRKAEAKPPNMSSEKQRVARRKKCGNTLHRAAGEIIKHWLAPRVKHHVAPIIIAAICPPLGSC